MTIRSFNIKTLLQLHDLIRGVSKKRSLKNMSQNIYWKILCYEKLSDFKYIRTHKLSCLVNPGMNLWQKLNYIKIRYSSEKIVAYLT